MTENPYELDGGDLNEADSWPEPTEPPEPDPLDFLDGVPAHEIVQALAVLHDYFHTRTGPGSRLPCKDDVTVLRGSLEEPTYAEHPAMYALRARDTRQAAGILALIVGEPFVPASSLPPGADAPF